MEKPATVPSMGATRDTEIDYYDMREETDPFLDGSLLDPLRHRSKA